MNPVIETMVNALNFYATPSNWFNDTEWRSGKPIPDSSFAHHDRGDIATSALTEYEERKDKELDPWRKALEGLTPGGSEFYDDPDKCVEFIRSCMNKPKRIVEAEERMNKMEEAGNHLLGWVETLYTQSQEAGYTFESLEHWVKKWHEAVGY